MLQEFRIISNQIIGQQLHTNSSNRIILSIRGTQSTHCNTIEILSPLIHVEFGRTNKDVQQSGTIFLLSTCRTRGGTTLRTTQPFSNGHTGEEKVFSTKYTVIHHVLNNKSATIDIYKHKINSPFN